MVFLLISSLGGATEVEKAPWILVSRLLGKLRGPPEAIIPPLFPPSPPPQLFLFFALNPHTAFSPHSEKLWRAVLKLERVSTDDGGSFEVRWLLHHPLQRLVELPRRYSAASHSSHSTSSSSSLVHLFLSYFLIDTICVVDKRDASISYTSTVPAPFEPFFHPYFSLLLPLLLLLL